MSCAGIARQTTLRNPLAIHEGMRSELRYLFSDRLRCGPRAGVISCTAISRQDGCISAIAIQHLKGFRAAESGEATRVRATGLPGRQSYVTKTLIAATPLAKTCDRFATGEEWL